MRNFVTAIRNRDSNALSRMAGCGPQPTGKGVHEGIEKLVDTLFANLKQLFPASVSTVLRDPAGEATAKRQWIAAFAENGIRTREQLKAGMQEARASQSPFWPSPGQFILWCRAGAGIYPGLPSHDAVMAEFRRYCAERGQYDSAEVFPWSAPEMYWIVTDLREAMLQGSLTTAEVERRAERKLADWQKRLSAGGHIPVPVRQIADKRRPPAAADILDPTGQADFRQKGGTFLARLRARGKAAL